MKPIQTYIPSWEDCNKTEFYPANIIGRVDVKSENEKIKMFLEKRGYSFRDSWNSYENGYTLSFEKIIDGIRIRFQYHWREEFDVYWWGDIHGFFNYFPNSKTLVPVGFFEIDSITERFATDEIFEKLEKNMVSVIKSQNIIQ